MDNQLYFDDFSARLYDIQYVTDNRDLEFYMEQSRKTDGAVLEVACGTGRLLIPILQDGCAIEGLDYSSAMLDVLRKKLKEKNLETRLYHQNMMDFKIDKKFGLIFIPFSSLFILNTQEEQISCLENCRRHLVKGGRLIVDFFVNSYQMTVSQDGKRRFIREMKVEDKTIHLYETIINKTITQQKYIHYYYEAYSSDGTLIGTSVRSVLLRWIYPDELKLMSAAAGFSKIDVFGGFRFKLLTSEKQRLVAIMEN